MGGDIEKSGSFSTGSNAREGAAIHNTQHQLPTARRLSSCCLLPFLCLTLLSPLFFVDDNKETAINECVASLLRYGILDSFGSYTTGRPSTSQYLLQLFVLLNTASFTIIIIIMSPRSLVVTRILPVARTSLVRRLHASSLQQGGATPPLPPFKRNPIKNTSVRLSYANEGTTREEILDLQLSIEFI